MAKQITPMSKPATGTLGKQQAQQAVSRSFYIPQGASNAQLADAVIRDSRSEHVEIAVSSIIPNPRQPRTHIDPTKLQELAGSIKMDGLLEEIVVRRSLTEENIFEIICGERRWRACSEILHWTHIPSTIRVATDAEMLRIAIIENEQRQQLSPLELAAGYQQLYDMVDGNEKRIYSIRSLAAELGKDKDHVQQHLKLMSAPPVLKNFMFENPTITVRIINELLDVEDPSDLEFLMEGVRQRRYKNEDIIFLVGQLKKDRAAAKAAATAATATLAEGSTTSQAVEKMPLPATSVNATSQVAESLAAPTDGQINGNLPAAVRASASEVSQHTPAPSPVLALADRKRMLNKDGSQIEKIIKRYKADRSSMNEMEQQALRESVQLWIEELQDLLK